MVRIGMNVEIFCAQIQLKKSCPCYTRNNCQGLSVMQKVLQPVPSKLLLGNKLNCITTKILAHLFAEIFKDYAGRYGEHDCKFDCNQLSTNKCYCAF